jgi:hypothetical protein
VRNIPFPDGLIVPDVRAPDTPNSLAAVILPDGRTVVHIQALARCAATGPLYGYVIGENDMISSDGLRGASAGSGLNSFALAIRPGELTNSEPILHTLGAAVWGKHLWWPKDANGVPLPGPVGNYSVPAGSFQWPADRRDAYAFPDGDLVGDYYGTNPNVLMGTRLCIPPSVTATQLGLESFAGRKLLQALQDYGAYIVDNTAWDAYYFVGDEAALDSVAWAAETRRDMNRLFVAMHAITNASPSAPGGPGTPRRPALPPLT